MWQANLIVKMCGKSYHIATHHTTYLIQLILQTMNTTYKHTIQRLLGCALLSALPSGVIAQNVRIAKRDGTIKIYDGSKQNIKIAPVTTINANDKVKTDQTLYDNLQALGNYTTFLKLVDTFADIQRAFKAEITDDERKYLGSIDTLTVFAADDEAYARFFANNNWTDAQGRAITSYEQLSNSQKASLIYMSYLPGFVTANCLHSNDYIRGNLRLLTWAYDRQFNLVPYKHTGGTDINTFPPQSSNQTNYTQYLNQHPFDGAWIGYGTVGDYSAALAYRGGAMIWNDDFWQYQGLNQDDLAFVGAADSEGKVRITIGNAHVTQPNQRCKNGYLHLVDEVVVPQPNIMYTLAQARLGDKCPLASSLIQRFNYLSYDYEYSTMYNNGDSTRIICNSLLDRVSTTTSQTPAVMLPTDEALKAFFLSPDNPLQQYYGLNQDNLYSSLMSMPREVLEPFVKEWFRTSFTDILPSRYSNMRSTLGHTLLADISTPEAYKRAVQQVIPAADGLVVVINAVPNAEDIYNELTLAKLVGKVTGAALSANDRYEFNGERSGFPFATNYQREMHNKPFTMFVPTDEGLKQYGLVDPMSMALGMRAQYRYWSLEPQSITTFGYYQIAVSAKAYRYDYNEARNTDTDRPLGGTYSSSAYDNCANSYYGSTKRQLLTDLLDQHIVLQDANSLLNTSQHWYLSRSGMPIYMKEHTSSSVVVDGGMQIDLNERNSADKHDCTMLYAGQNSTGTNLFIDRPMQPTTQNVYQRLQANDAFSTFFEYAVALNSAYSLKNQLFGDDASGALSRKYTIFADNNSNGRYGNANTMLVNFFHNFNYTIFVPTNEGMKRAVAAGLPTPDSIEQFVEDNSDNDGNLPDDKRAQAQAMYFTLLNFLKYHFCDKSYFYEPDLEAGNTEQTATACINTNNQQALMVSINSEYGMLSVRDASGYNKAVMPDLTNIIARDAEFNAQANMARYILSASNVVLHGIDGAEYLLFDNTLNGDFTRAWSTPSAARKFVKKYGK